MEPTCLSYLKKEKEINADMLPTKQEGFTKLCTMDTFFSVTKSPSNNV